jgi:hypothetical protein
MKANGDRLEALAEWVAKPTNPYFARAQVNRVWQHLIGRGIVDPGDDFRDTNPPSNPQLLDELTNDFITHRFDLRHMVQTILKSRVYQLSARATDAGWDEESHFARAIIRPLQAEQLLDAIHQVADVSPRYAGVPRGTRAMQLPGVSSGVPRRRSERSSDSEKFLAVFGKPVRSLSCECERSEDTTLARAFQLITGPVLNGVLAAKQNRLGKLLAEGTPNAEIVEELYLAALCRRPTERERQRTQALLDEASDRRAVLEDILWGLINAKEFLLRR